MILDHSYTPRGAALDLFAERGAEVLVAGPAGTGKSRACLEKLHAMALKNPGMRGLIVRKTLNSLGSTGLVTWREKVVPEGLLGGLLAFYGGSQSEAAAYRYVNGSVIVVGGMDKAMKIMSSEYDAIYVQEATELKKSDWEALTTRLRNGRVSFQQLLADCNPDAPTHWLKQRTDDGTTVMLSSRHEDNPTLFDDAGVPTDRGKAYLGKLDALTGVRKLRLRDGQWAAAEGLVYDEFDDAVHLVDALPEGSDGWDRVWSIDFGYRNPFVCQWWAIDPDGGMWLYRELYRTGQLVEDMARTMLSIVRKPNRGVTSSTRDRDFTWLERKPRAIVCDHDAEDRATLERHLGLPTVSADKRVKVGVQQTQERFRVQPNGLPRIFLCRNALMERDPELREGGLPCSTAEELPAYVWPEGVKPDQRENPVKDGDHGMDAMRYAVMQVDSGGPPRIRFIG